MGSTTLGQVVLDDLRKQTEQAVKSKLTRSIPHGLRFPFRLQLPVLSSCSDPLLQWWHPGTGMHSWDDLSSPRLLWSWCFLTAIDITKAHRNPSVPRSVLDTRCSACCSDLSFPNKIKLCELSVVGYACSSSTWEAEAGGITSSRSA